MNFEIVPITEEPIKGLCSAVDMVAREGKYLALLRDGVKKTGGLFVLVQI